MHDLPQLVVFIRHAQSLGNALTGRAYQKHADEAEALAWLVAEIQKYPERGDWNLTEYGRQQAERLRAYLFHRFGPGWFDAVITSGLRRAQQTQQIAYPAETVIVDDRLNEFPRGIFDSPDAAGFRRPRPLAEIDSATLAQRDAFLTWLCSGAFAKERVIIFGHGAWMASLRHFPHRLVRIPNPIGDGSLSNTGMIVLRPEAAQPDIPEAANWRLSAIEYNTTPKGV